MSAVLPGLQRAFSAGPSRASQRPIRARIDLAALVHNAGVARRLAGDTRIWAVIKADAYGHGLFPVAQALADAVDGFALLETETAVALRQAGHAHPVLLLEGFFSPEDLPAVHHYGLTPVIHTPAQLQMLAASPWRPAAAYIKFNTGMNRLGFRAVDLAAVRQQLLDLGVRELTLMSHFAEADTAVGIAAPLALFRQAQAMLELPCSLANSATLIRYPEARGDWARPGIMLYGSSPFAEIPACQLGLKPVMSLESRLIGIQSLEAGERVGYGGLFVAPAPLRIGVVACGYADGYPRQAPLGTPVAVAGCPSRVLGRVSMDMLMVDLSAAPAAQVGSPVTLWGEGAGGVVDVDAVAAAAGTISYELFCALAPRVPVTWQ